MVGEAGLTNWRPNQKYVNGSIDLCGAYYAGACAGSSLPGTYQVGSRRIRTRQAPTYQRVGLAGGFGASWQFNMIGIDF